LTLLSQTIDVALQEWHATEEELPLLRLAVQLVVALRQVTAFDELESIQKRLLMGFQPDEILRDVIEKQILTTAQR